MQSRALRYLLAGLLVVVLISGSFAGGVMTGTQLPGIIPVGWYHGSLPAPLSGLIPQSKTNQAAAANLEAVFAPFWETWKIVHDQYVDQPVNDLSLMRGAIRGMLQALGDTHTLYIDPDQLKQTNIPLQGGYEGIGAWIDASGEYLTITSPMPGSPAEKAGLKPGDQVIAVDGKDMTGVAGQLVVNRIMGPSGTQVKLTIVRAGEAKPFDVLVTRQKIDVPTIQGKMLDGSLAYIRIASFGASTDQELRASLQTLLAKHPAGLIIDLRNDGGGYLTTAIDVSSEFISKGTILYERSGNGKEQSYEAKSGGLATSIPLVVLVNSGTASASEILSGAIQDYQRGKLVGETTYGKGSVQNGIALKNDQGEVRVTVAHWLTPLKRLIDGKGLKPDFMVPLTENDAKANLDPQLQKAIELLSPPSPAPTAP